MHWILWLLIALAVLFAAGLAGIYFFTFFNMPGRHMQPDDYLKSPMFVPFIGLLGPKLERMKEEPFEEVSIRARDGVRLKGRYYHTRYGAPFALLVHGYRGHAFGDFAGIFGSLKRFGFKILLIDQRACGSSGGLTITFGVKERLDTVDWLNFMKRRFGSDISVLLMGISLGSATVLMASDLEITPNVKAIAADCGYTSPRAIIEEVGSHHHLPMRLLWPFVSLSAKLFGRFDPEEASALESVAGTRIPILFAHGMEDDFVPYAMMPELYAACASEKGRLDAPGAGHGQSWAVNPLRYETTLKVFLQGKFEGLQLNAEGGA